MPGKFDLIVISPPNDFEGEAGYLTCFFEKGLAHYHVRKPLWNLQQMEQFLQAVPAIYHSRMVIHSHFNLIHTYSLKGIHLNGENRLKENLYNSYPVISTSFHSFEELIAQSFNYEYVFLGPVFDSISKAGYKPAFDIETLGDTIIGWRLQTPAPAKVIALGGIHAQNIQLVKRHAFSGAAVIGAVWNESNPVKAFEALQQAAME